MTHTSHLCLCLAVRLWCGLACILRPPVVVQTMLLILVTLAVTNPTLVTGALLTCPAPFMSRDMSLSPGCVTSTDSEISRDNILSLVTSSPRPQLCVSLCHTILEEVAMIGVLADPKNLRCWCLGSAPDEG